MIQNRNSVIVDHICVIAHHHCVMPNHTGVIVKPMLTPLNASAAFASRLLA
jgi:hypothetical protein